MIEDFTNGLFEGLGSLVLWKNVQAIRRDKIVRGVDWRTTVFFTAWGFWNLFYYPHLGQWLSFAGGCSIVMVNLTWLWHVRRYR